jgi:DNA-binding SARP family transcriptional activator
MVLTTELLLVSPPRGGVVARLSVRLLGPLQIGLDGEPATGFVSDKVRALLAFLALEAEQPHRREKIAGLLWPDWPESSARANLRRALANLRRVIRDHEASPPFLHISRQTLQFNTASDAWIDVVAFTDLVQAKDLPQGTIRQLEQAVELYGGDFLEGFSVADSPAFEEWLLLNRERLRRLVTDALHRLAEGHEQAGQYEPALRHAWRQVELDPWREKAHRQLMRLLTLSGQRGAALAQYETCRSLLAEELGVEPGEETTRLYQKIRDGVLSREAKERRGRGPAPAAPATLPPFLTAEPRHASPPAPFVARERELGLLDHFLGLALAGQGRVVFVTGEAGSGKTALVQAFTRRAQEAHAGPSTRSLNGAREELGAGPGQDLVVASGDCNAYTGIGDPYLPFREIMGQLTGDVESRWSAGTITREHARRLWNTLPLAARALVEQGPDLIDTLVPGAALLERASLAAAGASASGGRDWLPSLQLLTGRKPTGPGAPGAEQTAIFEQVTRVLRALASHAPLVLVLDDLHWADAGSISLLFHLGRRLAGSRILVVGTYRAEELTIGRDGEQHPLEPVVNELQRDFGDITVNLAQAKGRGFVEALLDSEPNRLGSTFREMLYRQTGGHPLFTIELLRGLQERGDLAQDPEGRWVEGATLDWQTLPARVEAVIAQRIGRLARPLQAALRVASVEGEVFTAEVVARVRTTDEQEMLRRLSGELDRRHRLVHAQGIRRMDGQRLSQYRFRHILFQRYVYHSLDDVERAHLHEAVGNTLETLYRDQTEATTAIAGQLARHFQEAGIAEKAIPYLQQAGERAVQLSAYEEGIALLSKGLALLEALPDPAREAEHLARARQELALQFALGMAYVGRQGYGPQGEEAYARARELSQQLGETDQLCLVLGRLSIFHYVRSEHQRALGLAEEALSVARRANDPLHIALGHRYMGCILLCVGEYLKARAHLEQMISFYDPQRHHGTLVSIRFSDAGTSALAYRACCLWCLGYPDQAMKQSREALALARELGHPWSLADVLWYAGCMVNEMLGDVQALKNYAEELMRLAEEKVPLWSGGGIVSRGEALVMLGQAQEGMAQIREGMAVYPAGMRYYFSGRLRFLAEAQAKACRPEEGLTTLAEALALVEETDERHWEAELYRVRGELLLAQGDETDAEASFHKAIDVARRQQAKSWELRATVSLCRLRQHQGRREEAHQRLAEIYGWFTEGFDSPDLVEAQTLLRELSRSVGEQARPPSGGSKPGVHPGREQSRRTSGSSER